MVQEPITSRQNPRIRLISALSDKKERDRSGLFRFDGHKLFAEACENGVELVQVVVRESSRERLGGTVGSYLQRHEDNILVVSDTVFEKLTDQKASDGIVCVARKPKQIHSLITEAEAFDLPAGETAVFLETVQDAGNLGTILRGAAAFGISRLVLSCDCADLYHPRTLRGAMGALFRQRVDLLSRDLPISLVICRAREQGHTVYATTLGSNTKTLGEEPLPRGTCFVIGNEGHGLSDETVASCDACMKIPMRVGNESLNAAMAATVCMWELSGKE